MLVFTFLTLSTLVLCSDASTAPTCPAGEDVTFFPDEEDCSKYWECLNGDATLLQCPGGQYFNPEVLGCDLAERVDCENAQTIAPTVNPVVPNCPDNEDITFIPDKDCTRYWECLNNEGTLMQCPGGQYFNPEILACDSPNNVDCSNDK